MANIGSETSRVQKALEAGKDHRAAFLSRDLAELASLNKYLDQFALIRKSA